MKINKQQFKKWIAALDSGKFKQGECYLQDDRGYCCLGVGCKVTIPNKLQVYTLERLHGQYPKSQPAAPVWLKEINDDFEGKTGLYLTQLNDAEDFTFSEIATLLELVYIHKILD